MGAAVFLSDCFLDGAGRFVIRPDGFDASFIESKEALSYGECVAREEGLARLTLGQVERRREGAGGAINIVVAWGGGKRG